MRRNRSPVRRGGRGSCSFCKTLVLTAGLRILLPAIACLGIGPGVADGKTVVRLSGWDQAIYDSLAHPRADTSACWYVAPNAVWATDLGTYRFDEGTLAFFAPVGGKPTGCLFRGRGTLTFAPPTAIERGQLRRFCGDSILTASFSEVCFRYFDSAAVMGLYACRGAPARLDLPSDRILRAHDRRAADDLPLDLPARGWQSHCDSVGADAFLYAAVHCVNREPLHFLQDPGVRESITVWRRSPGNPSHGAVDLICSYNPPGYVPEMRQGGFGARKYVADVYLQPSTAVKLDVRLTGSLARPLPGTLGFVIAPKVQVDSIWVAGQAAGFIYDDDDGWLVLRIADTQADSIVTVRFVYGGDKLLYKYPWGDFEISYTTRWLPTVGRQQRADYDVTFRYPRHYEVVAAGEPVGDSIAGDWRIARWRTYDPALFFSFNYGDFDRLSLAAASGPTIEVYRSRNHLRGLFNGDMRQEVGTEIRDAVRLFSELLVPYAWPRLAATEIPSVRGQGFPQLLHLAWYSFEKSERGVTDAFIAHEVAHQWFGHLVGWATYHDQWLSEGFAEYAAAMYLERCHPESEAFARMLKRWRDLILRPGGHADWHEGPQAPPIWLGFRCASERAPASYEHLVYAKGAYVLHMLREMLRDETTGSDERFVAMMRDYVAQYAHGNATTEEFRRVVEAHFGRPMGWFFDQWVYGVGVPRFEYRWSVHPTSDGRVQVEGRIDQFDVDSSFRSEMPITFVLPDTQITIRQEVIGLRTAFVSPVLAEPPRAVIFNDRQAILCREKVVAHP